MKAVAQDPRTPCNRLLQTGSGHAAGRGPAGCKRLQQTVASVLGRRARSRRGAGSWGTAFACLLRDRGHDVTLAARDPEQVDAIRDTGRNPRYARDADLSGIAAALVEDAPVESAELVVVAVPSRVFGEVVGALPGTAPVLSLTKGLDPSTGERLSSLVTRRPVAVLSGPNIAEEIARGLPGGRGRRVRGSRARGPAPARAQLGDFPRLRQRGHRRRRALRRGEERDRARRRRRRRARPRGQREGGARLSRGCGDAAARRGGGRAPGHVRRARGHGRPDRHVLVACRPEPARGRADRPGRDRGGSPCRDRDGRRRADDCARAPRPLANGSTSSCRSPMVCVPCSKASRSTDLVQQLMRREPTTE